MAKTTLSSVEDKTITVQSKLWQELLQLMTQIGGISNNINSVWKATSKEAQLQVTGITKAAAAALDEANKHYDSVCDLLAELELKLKRARSASSKLRILDRMSELQAEFEIAEAQQKAAQETYDKKVALENKYNNYCKDLNHHRQVLEENLAKRRLALVLKTMEGGDTSQEQLEYNQARMANRNMMQSVASFMDTTDIDQEIEQSKLRYMKAVNEAGIALENGAITQQEYDLLVARAADAHEDETTSLRNARRDARENAAAKNRELRPGLIGGEVSNSGLGKILNGFGGDLGDKLGDKISGGLTSLMGSGSPLGNIASNMVGGSPMFAAVKAVAAGVLAIRNKMNTQVEDAAKVFAENMGKVDSRLYGDLNGKTFTEILNNIDSHIGASPFVNQKDLINNVVQLTQQGIDFNIEQRAYWMTLNDRMVATFDALDGTLTRMIRLQQTDITMAQMGIEAAITRLLNGVFKDSSYLNNLYDSVYTAISDASSIQLNTDQSTQFNYTVQKWLGGLYSVGMNEQTVTNIANALNALGTGDVSNLENGTQTLLQLSAVRGGLSYADLLTNGLNADNTNTLLKNMVEYLRDIATNTSDNVVRSQFGTVLQMGMSDWRAIQNITDADISNLTATTMNQQSAEAEVTNLLLNAVSSRTHFSTMVDNAVENAMWAFGKNVAGNTGNYVMWQISNTITKLADSLGGEDSVIGGLISDIGGVLAAGTALLPILSGLFDMAGSVITAVGNIATGNMGGFMDSNLFSLTMNRGTGEFANSASILQQNNGVTSGTSSSGGISFNLSGLTGGVGDLFGGLFGGGLSTMESSTGGGYHTSGGGSFGEDEYEADSNYGGGGDFETIETASADRAMTSFELMENSTAATAENIISGEEDVLTKDISDLYSELFEKQTKPIKVNLTTEDGLNTLGQLLMDVCNKLNSGAIRVDIEDNDISTLASLMHS